MNVVIEFYIIIQMYVSFEHLRRTSLIVNVPYPPHHYHRRTVHDTYNNPY